MLLGAMNSFPVIVEKKIKTLLRGVFAVIFYGWSLCQTCYLSVFEMLPDSETFHEYSQAFLSFKCFIKEPNLSSQPHKDAFYDILQLYRKNYSKVECLIGDRCATNRSTTNSAKIYLVECASRQLRVCVEAVSRFYLMLPSKIHTFMVCLKTTDSKTALSTVFHLSPVLLKSIRWSSVKDIIKRYTKLCSAIKKIVSANSQLFPGRNWFVIIILKTISDLYILIKRLQDESIQIWYVRDYPDAAPKLFAEVKQHSSWNSNIIKALSFEPVLVRIRKSQQHQEPLNLTCAKISDVKHLMMSEVNMKGYDSNRKQSKKSEVGLVF